MLPRPALLLVILFAVPACSGGGSSGPPELAPGSTELRNLGDGVSGEAGAVVSALLQSAGGVPVYSPRPAFGGALGQGDRLRFHALAHLQMMATTAGAGAHAAGSVRIRRLAGSSAAPVDGNGNGTNLDEVLAAENARFASLSGAANPESLAPSFMPWQQVSAELPASVAGVARADAAAWRLGVGAPVVDVEDLGYALLTRTAAASDLLNQRHGHFLGGSAAEGQLGLMLLSQALAIDETLLRRLFFDGDALGGFDDAAALAAYDPSTRPQWVPATFRVVEDSQLVANDPSLRGIPGSYLVDVGGSDLAGLAVLLRAAAELALLAAPDNHHHNLRSLFVDGPFASPGAGGQPGIDDQEVTYLRDVLPILQSRCAACHSAATFPTAGFDAVDYDRVMNFEREGRRAVVVGDHSRSALWILTTGNWVNPPNRTTPISRMPLGRDPLTSAQTDLIAEWIDTGAQKEPTVVMQPPTPGIELARVLFSNLTQLHATADSPFVLHHRVDHHGAGDTERSSYVDARALGLALTGAAAFAWAERGEARVEAREFVESLAGWAGDRLVDPAGRVAAGFDVSAGQAVGGADLATQAAMVSGLFAAARLTFAPSVYARARLAADALLAEFSDLATGLFDTEPGELGRRYTAPVIAAVLEALVDLVRDGDPRGRPLHDNFIAAILPRLVYAEFDGFGEVLGDGIADTDGNGIPEPALAGGQYGRAAVLAAVVSEGPEPRTDREVTWLDQILPLFRRSCAGCHVDGAALGDYRLDTPALAGRAGYSMRSDLVVPGDPEASFLYRKLADRFPADGAQMPRLQPPLDARGLRLVYDWIQAGAKYR